MVVESRIFKRFAWLEVGSVKVVLSRPAHQRVTQTVRQFLAEDKRLKLPERDTCRVYGIAV
jgi:hypothetical protein